MTPRLLRIDSLRGLAVFGILLINMFAFTYGAKMRFGVLDSDSSDAEGVVIFLIAAFAEQKFYPIFAFLFGAGFALQTGRACRTGPALAATRVRYLRRTGWLLGCGILADGQQRRRQQARSQHTHLKTPR